MVAFRSDQVTLVCVPILISTHGHVLVASDFAPNANDVSMSWKIVDLRMQIQVVDCRIDHRSDNMVRANEQTRRNPVSLQQKSVLNCGDLCKPSDQGIKSLCQGNHHLRSKSLLIKASLHSFCILWIRVKSSVTPQTVTECRVLPLKPQRMKYLWIEKLKKLTSSKRANNAPSKAASTAVWVT